MLINCACGAILKTARADTLFFGSVRKEWWKASPDGRKSINNASVGEDFLACCLVVRMGHCPHKVKRVSE